jgi:thiosulfate reductase cytochrome b subunit
MRRPRSRTILRWIHLVLAIPIIGYIYSPFDQIPNYAPATRFVFVPVIVLSGLWMWKGHVLRRLFRKDRPDKALQQHASTIKATANERRREEFFSGHDQ